MPPSIVSLSDPALTLDSPTGTDRSPERMREVAREFEAVLIHQVLRHMREAARWIGEDEDQLFGTRLLETIDGELARQLAAAGGLGLTGMVLPRLTEVLETDGGTPAATTGGGSAAPSPPASTGPDGRVTSGFGYRIDPLAADRRFHAGLDLRAAYGTEIGAAAPGRVVQAGDQGGYGLTVLLEHGRGLRTRYAHLSSIAVSEGDSVGARDPIGRAGQTGRATGSHLHFELIRDGKQVDPASIEGGMDALLKKLRLDADWHDTGAGIGAGADDYED